MLACRANASSARRSSGRPCARSFVPLVIVSSLVLSLFIVPHLVTQLRLRRLRSYAGQDLRKLADRESAALDRLIETLIPQTRAEWPEAQAPASWYRALLENLRARLNPGYPPARLLFGWETWYLWRVPFAEDQEGLVLFQAQRLWTIPGESRARIFVLDNNGNLLAESILQTGWRIDIVDAAWESDSGHGFPCVKVSTCPAINGADICSQYYAPIDRAFALVRMENRQGESIRNAYYAENHTIGAAVPVRTAVEWEDALYSSDRVELLKTLVWLDGRHSGDDNDSDALLLQEVRSRPRVRAALRLHLTSDDEWVRTAARLANEPAHRW
jgi:hypothetical protein